MSDTRTTNLHHLRDPRVDAENSRNTRETLVSIATHLVSLATNPANAQKLLVFHPNHDLREAMDKFGRAGVYRVNGYAVVISTTAPGATEENPLMAVVPRHHRNSEWALPFLTKVNFKDEIPSVEEPPSEGLLSEEAAA